MSALICLVRSLLASSRASIICFAAWGAFLGFLWGFHEYCCFACGQDSEIEVYFVFEIVHVLHGHGCSPLLRESCVAGDVFRVFVGDEVPAGVFDGFLRGGVVGVEQGRHPAVVDSEIFAIFTFDTPHSR